MRLRLASGRTLGQVAVEEGRPIDGLEDALLADLKWHLDADVAAGRVSTEREAQILAAVKRGIDQMVERRSAADRGRRLSGVRSSAATSRKRAPVAELSAVARPPCASAASRTIASPRPAPGFERAVAAR